MPMSEYAQNVAGSYDARFEVKFDHQTRKNPQTRLYKSHDDYARAHSYPSEAVPPILEAAYLANINLQTRNLVGLVLGSTIVDLWKPFKNLVEAKERLHGHHDFDVLILNPLLEHHPAPQEWGIDWWIRPPDHIGGYPTNGNTGLWYDISLKEGLSQESTCPSEKEEITKSSLNLDLSNGEITYDPDITAPQIETTVTTISPGLYLPDKSLMDEIADYAEWKAKDRNREVLNLIEDVEAELRILTPKTYKIRTTREVEIMFTEIKNAYQKISSIEEILKINIHHGLKSFQEIYEYYKRSYDPMTTLIKLIEFIRGQSLRLRGHLAQKRTDYSYLRIPEEYSKTTQTPLPVLPSRLLKFHGTK